MYWVWLWLNTSKEVLKANTILHSLLGLLAKFKMLGVLPAHLPLVLDAGTVLVSVPPVSCAGFVCCHCTGRWAVLDNTHGKDSGAFAEGCCTATTMALTSSKQKYNFTLWVIALTFASHLPPDLVSITFRNKTAGNMNEIRHPMVDPFIPRINSTVTKHKK